MKQYFDKIYTDGFEKILDILKEKITTEEKLFLITANPETLIFGTEIRELDEVLKSDTSIIVPDGIGVVKAANVLGYDVKERIAGIEIAQEVLRFLNTHSKSLYLFGATDEVLKQLVCVLREKYPGINLLGYQNGYVQNKDLIMEQIVESQADVVLIALGIPMQEMLIARYYNHFSKGIFIGVGGAFDVLSGVKKRAPRFFILFNLEWLYRIVKEPKRIKRFIHSNMKFVGKVIRMYCNGRRNTKER